MKRVSFAVAALLCLIAAPAFGRGVSPYLPLNLDPEIEQQIERLLILADKPVLTRPIAAATVLDALTRSCQADPVLCLQVRRYLQRYMRNWSVTEASIEVAAGQGDRPVPNAYGLTAASSWNASVSGFWQPTDHVLVNLGAVAYDDEVIPQGSVVSVGFDRAQLDVGYRARWLSPFSDSGMLSSTEAATMPSITLSNYLPLTRWGFHYEAFGALMSESDAIEFGGALTRGRPHLSGVHLSVEPAHGWSLGVNRIMQYGGGSRPGGFQDLLKAFFNPSRYDNTSPRLSADEQFGNQLASITSELLVPARVPFAVYFEYAGEDTSNGKNYLLGNTALSAGIRFPRLARRFDLTYEVSEWQNGWYVNTVYGDGLTSKGLVIGHWGGDERQFNDGVGAQSHMLRVGYDVPFGGRLEARVRTLSNEKYTGVAYERAYDATLRYSRTMHSFTVGAEVYAGRDVFGDDFSRVGAFVRLLDQPQPVSASFDSDPPATVGDRTELFVDAGFSANRVRIDPDAVNVTTQSNGSGHVGIGVRRSVSDRSDLGARLELDGVDGSTLLSVRALDYRYRFAGPMALSVFVGASRYDVATPAYGLYYGLGVQWRNLLPGWDAGIDIRNAKKVARDHLLPSDPTSTLRPDSFYTIDSYTLVVSKRF